MAKKKTGTDAVMSVGQYVITTILMSLPVVGLILTIVWAFVSYDNMNKRNYARAYLILMAIFLGLALISTLVITLVAGSLMRFLPW